MAVHQFRYRVKKIKIVILVFLISHFSWYFITFVSVFVVIFVAEVVFFIIINLLLLLQDY